MEKHIAVKSTINLVSMFSKKINFYSDINK